MSLVQVRGNGRMRIFHKEKDYLAFLALIALQVDATDLAYQFGVFAQNNKAGPVVAKGDDVDPDGQMACTPPSATS